MKTWEERLRTIEAHISQNHVTIMILGLGSVGSYLLDYLVGKNDPSIRVVVVGRNREKMESAVNIVRVAASIRKQNKSQIEIVDSVDFNEVDGLAHCIADYCPDFIVNTSRVYSGLKYGSISWKVLRAYGIWAPLAMKYIKNIMEACSLADSDGIVINTSYSDAVIPWLRTAGKSFPDFGSGNINHLIPRLQFGAAKIMNIPDFWNVDVMLATSHFHDVVISKEGQNEGINQLLKVCYQGKELGIQQEKLLSMCKIAMPVDGKRNMMNASSNYEIISAFLESWRNRSKVRFFSPGVFGKIGGYPVIVNGLENHLEVQVDTSVFALEEMEEANRKSIYLDGIENVENGQLTYTDELLEKTKHVLGVTLPKHVDYNMIDKTADYLIEQIIKPNLA